MLEKEAKLLLELCTSFMHKRRFIFYLSVGTSFHFILPDNKCRARKASGHLLSETWTICRKNLLRKMFLFGQRKMYEQQFRWRHFYPLTFVTIGREPWSSDYGRRLTFWRSWVRIPVPYTGWTFFTLICCKVGLMFVWKRPKLNEKDADMAHFFKKTFFYYKSL